MGLFIVVLVLGVAAITVYSRLTSIPGGVDGETDGLTLALIEGLTDSDTEADGLTLGDTDAEPAFCQ